MSQIVSLIVVSIVVLGLLGPAQAQAQAERRYDQLEQSLGQLYPVQEAEISEITLGHLVAIGVGALVGAAVFQTFLEGTVAAVAGFVLGGLVGDWWFEEKLWPFENAFGLPT